MKTLQTDSGTSPDSGQEKPATGRQRIDVAEPLHVRVEQAIAALASGNDKRHPDVMVRGNELVRMTERGELEPFVPDSLRVALSERVALERQTDDEVKPAGDPPADYARAILSEDSEKYVGLPRVERVVDVPVLGADDQLITEPGYHETGALYYRPAEDLKGVGPRDPHDTDDLDWALSLLLNDLLGDFDFADEASKAHALALCLLPFVRERIGKGSTPLHVVLAPDNGSGKTWLAQAALAPGCGVVPVTPGTASDEEWRKRITASLLAGAPAVLLDNLSGKLDTGALASALTTDRWSERILGESREVNLPIRNLWVATGNNLDLSPEMVRRAVAVFLEPGDVKASEKPTKSFRHPELLEWAAENRRALVEAALTLIEHWRLGPAEVVGGYVFARTEDEPIMSGPTLGSYVKWARIVGGILESSHVAGFLDEGNRERLKSEADDESREAREFFAAWRAHSTDPMQVKEIAPLCQFGEALADVVPEGPASATPSKFNRALTTWLTQHRNRTVGGYKLVSQKLNVQGHPTGWRVQDRAQRESAD